LNSFPQQLAVDPLLFYAEPGSVTDPGEHGDLLQGLPKEVAQLCKVVQGLMLHIFWAERYAVKLPEERKQEVQLRRVTRQLERIRQLDESPVTSARPLERRLVGNCRDFSTLLCAMLRHQGVAARARCGFGAYFMPDHYEDHWVCECWRGDQQRWVMVDPQLDSLQQQVLQIQFDPLDMPPGQFVTGGQAWLMCRSGQEDPEKFGIFDMQGMWFIRGNVVRDFLALNKIELLPWDGGWGLINDDPIDASTQTPEAALLDHIAHLTLNADESFNELRALCENDSRLQSPPDLLR
jgi:hypothetical protein